MTKPIRSDQPGTSDAAGTTAIMPDMMFATGSRSRTMIAAENRNMRLT